MYLIRGSYLKYIKNFHNSTVIKEITLLKNGKRYEKIISPKKITIGQETNERMMNIIMENHNEIVLHICENGYNQKNR